MSLKGIRHVSLDSVRLLTPFDPDQLHYKQLSAMQGVVLFLPYLAELKPESKLP